MLEKTKINEKQVIWAHPASECKGPHCAIHNPSPHTMSKFVLYWRDDRGLMERICSHGVGHPDPDDLQFKHDHQPNYRQYAWGVHGCDGCCAGAYDNLSWREF